MEADLLVVTEGCEAVLPRGGHVVTSADDYGYRLVRGRRKVLLWSRRPWVDTDALGARALPPGRFVAATTATPIGDVRVLGVCIPWRAAHVTTGQRNRRPWEDHLAYLRALSAVVAQQDAPAIILAGDFNQRVPRVGQPSEVFEALQRTLGTQLQIATGGNVAGACGHLLDHVAHGPDLAPSNVEAWSSLQGGRRLSDHDGVGVQLVAARQARAGVGQT